MVLSQRLKLQLSELQRELTTFTHLIHTDIKSQQKYFILLSISINSKLRKLKAINQNEKLQQEKNMTQKISLIIRSYDLKVKNQFILPKGNLAVGYQNMLRFYLDDWLSICKFTFLQMTKLQKFHYSSVLPKIVKKIICKMLVCLTLAQKAKLDIQKNCQSKSYLLKNINQIKQRLIQQIYDYCSQKALIIEQITEKFWKLLEKFLNYELFKSLRKQYEREINWTQSQVGAYSNQFQLSFQKQHRLQATPALNSQNLHLAYIYKRQARNNFQKQQSSNVKNLQQILEPMISIKKVEMLQQLNQQNFCQCRLIKIKDYIPPSQQLCEFQNWNHQPFDVLQEAKLLFKQGQQQNLAANINNQPSIQAQRQIRSLIQKEIKIIFTIRDYARCVGVIKCAWYRLGKLELISFSTAFAISEWLVITCGHSVFDKKRNRHCDKIQFIPFAGATRYSTKQDVYQSRDQDFIRFQKLQKQQYYGIKPLRKDYAVFILKRPFKNKCYLRLSDEPLRSEQKLQILGYPCRDYNSSTQAVGTFFKRMDLRGQLNRVKEGYILEHNMDSQSGHSGSPILRIYNKKNEQQIQVVGIHTHKGYGFMNEGLLITRALKGKIQSFCQQLQTIHNIGKASKIRQQNLCQFDWMLNYNKGEIWYNDQ